MIPEIVPRYLFLTNKLEKHFFLIFSKDFLLILSFSSTITTLSIGTNPFFSDKSFSTNSLPYFSFYSLVSILSKTPLIAVISVL